MSVSGRRAVAQSGAPRRRRCAMRSARLWLPQGRTGGTAGVGHAVRVHRRGSTPLRGCRQPSCTYVGAVEVQGVVAAARPHTPLSLVPRCCCLQGRLPPETSTPLARVWCGRMLAPRRRPAATRGRAPRQALWRRRGSLTRCPSAGAPATQRRPPMNVGRPPGTLPEHEHAMWRGGVAGRLLRQRAWGVRRDWQLERLAGQAVVKTRGGA